jgi:hypothetical protein
VPHVISADVDEPDEPAGPPPRDGERPSGIRPVEFIVVLSAADLILSLLPGVPLLFNIASPAGPSDFSPCLKILDEYLNIL